MSLPDLELEELEEWRTIFNLFDVDGDQSITCEELGVVLRSANTSRSRFVVFATCDIAYPEVGAGCRSMGQNPSERELREMIGEMDEDDSGTVDFQEFVILMKKKRLDDEGNDDIEEAFRVFDTKNDG